MSNAVQIEPFQIDQTIRLPEELRLDPATGVLDGATARYEKRLDELAELYYDTAAYEQAVAQSPGEVSYVVYEHRPSGAAGDLVTGTSTLFPGRIGDEFRMTRGHLHEVAERPETYFCLSGHGVMLTERFGETRTVELRPGVIAYVAGHWIHRSVNVGDSPLVTLFSYPADAGQDYSPIARQGGMASLIFAGAEAGWRLTPNPRYAHPKEEDR